MYYKQIRKTYKHCRPKIFTHGWITALSTFGLLFLAAYGLFFTSIPQEVAQALNEEVVVLKAEKHLAESQLKAVQEKEFALQRSVEQLAAVHEGYTQRAAKAFIPAYIESITKLLNKQEEHIQRAIQLDEAYSWLKRNKEIEKEMKSISGRGYKEQTLIGKLIDERVDTMPEAFDRTLLVARFDNNPPKRSDEIIKSFHVSLSEIKTIETGFDIIKKANSIAQMSLFMPDDHKKLLEAISSYTFKMGKIYKKPLRVIVKKKTSVANIKKKALSIQKNVAAIREDTAMLSLYLSKHFNVPHLPTKPTHDDDGGS